MSVSVTGGSQVLFAAASGAGKSGAMWGMHRAMGPTIREGLVRIRMIDLEGGTETALGRDLFYRRAIDMDAANRPIARGGRGHADHSAADERAEAAEGRGQPGVPAGLTSSRSTNRRC